MPCSASVLLITATIASSVNSVPSRMSSTRSSFRSGGGVSCINAQQRSKTVRRTESGTLNVSRSKEHRRNDQDELQIRQARVFNVKRLHDAIIKRPLKKLA